MSKNILLVGETSPVSLQQTNAASIAEELSERLKLGVVHFAFIKADGSFREAFGTLNSDYLPVRTPEEIAKQAENPKPKNPDMQAYWDIEAKGFRACSKERLLIVF